MNRERGVRRRASGAQEGVHDPAAALPVAGRASRARPVRRLRPQNRGVVLTLVAAVLFSAAATSIGQGDGRGVLAVDGEHPRRPAGCLWSSEYGTSGPVEEYPATAPGVLGPDPVLDAYATSCFDGEMQACDDLYYESPPMSDYEQYAVTGGGRVEQFAVVACTDLDQRTTRRSATRSATEMVEGRAPEP